MKRNMCKKMLPVLIAALFTLLFSIPAMAATPKLKSYPSSKVTAKQIATELSKAFKINRITTPSKNRLHNTANRIITKLRRISMIRNIVKYIVLLKFSGMHTMLQRDVAN